MDEELKQLAALVLRNAFWRDFSELVNVYLKASSGLDVDAQERQMGDLTSIYGRNVDADSSGLSLNIWTKNGQSDFDTTGHETILEALEHPPATEVYVEGKMAFKRIDGEWHLSEKEKQ